MARGQKVGISLGINSSNLGELDYDGYSYKNLPGLNAGVVVIFPKRPLMNLFSFETGVYLSAKNSKSTLVIDYFNNQHHTYYIRTIEEISRLKFLEIPFQIKPSFKVKESRLFLSIGAYYAVGLNGTIETIEHNTPNSRKVIWDAEDPDFYVFKKKDMGLTAGIGYEIRALQVSFLFNRGLKNVHNPDFDIYHKNYITTFNLALTCFLINRK